MDHEGGASSAAVATTIGLLALASAMGIGRFSLTPVLPLMQRDMVLTIAQGSWLATANYAGYLIGAVACMTFAPSSARSIRWGMAGVAVLTLGMGLTESFVHWLVFRFSGGAASAFVLIGVSAWAVSIPAKIGRAKWTGVVFSGVGVGIVLAGLIGLAAGLYVWGASAVWLVMGMVATVLACVTWKPLANDAAPSSAGPRKSGRLTAPAFIIAFCYGLFGYGYIIPATFLPALARAYIDNPAVFGLVWPVFGLAAAVSTVAAAQLGSSRRLWTFAQWVMVAGLAAPVVYLSIGSLMFAALCVGGTFMVITMAGVKEVLRMLPDCASRGVGLMTVAFATGQIVGPLSVSLFAGSENAFVATSLFAAGGLVLGNCILLATARSHDEQFADTSSIRSHRRSPRIADRGALNKSRGMDHDGEDILGSEPRLRSDDPALLDRDAHHSISRLRHH